MKKLVFALALFLLVSCDAFGPTLSKGVYFCSTNYGTIYLELLSGGNCLIRFDGCKEDSGTYRKDGDQLTLIATATDWKESGKNRDWVTYRFSDHVGLITESNQFSIEADVVYGRQNKTATCRFIKKK